MYTRRVHNACLILLIALLGGGLAAAKATMQEQPPRPQPMTDEQRKKFAEMIQAQAAKNEEARKKEAEQRNAAQRQPTPVLPPAQQPLPGQTPPPAPAPSPSTPVTSLVQRPPLSGDQVQLSYDNADLYDFVNQIADTLGITPIVIDPAIKGNVTIHSSAPMSKNDIFPLFNLILKNNNAALVKQGNIYQIVPISDALKRGLELIEHRPPEPPAKPPETQAPEKTPETQAAPPPSQPGPQPSQTPSSSTVPEPQQPPVPDRPAPSPAGPQAAAQPPSGPQAPRLSTHVIRAEFVAVRDLIEPLKLFMTDGGVIMPYDRLNMLIITDYSDSVQKIMQIIRMLDDAFINPELIEMIEIKYNAAADVADDLRKIFGSGAKDSATGIYFIALDRMNVILVMANSKRAMGEFKRWVDRLDATTGRGIQTYVYTVENSTASNIMLILTALFGGEGGGGATTPGSGRTGGQGGGLGSGGAAAGFGSANTAATGGGGFGGGPFAGAQGGGAFTGGGGFTGGGAYGQYGGGFGGAYGGQYGGGGFGGGGYGMPYGGYGGGGVFGGGSQLGPRLNQAPAMSAQIFRGGALTGLQESVRIVANDVNNTLIIQASPADYNYLLDVIKKLDVLPRQVIIDARIFEVDLTDALSFGIAASLQARSTGPHLTTSTMAQTNGALTASTFAFVGDAREILLNLDALRQKTKVRVLEAPSVLALDGSIARIVVGGEVPYPAGSFFGGSGIGSTTVQYRDTGISLIVMPRISASGVVTMDIAQEVSTPGAPTPGGPEGAPTFNKSSVATTLAVKDGETVAIAGLIRDSNNWSRGGVPFFSEIPLLGSLFGRTNRTSNRSELLILISPHVIRTPERFSEMTQELKDSLRNVRKLVDDKQREHLEDMEGARKERSRQREKDQKRQEKNSGREPSPASNPKD